jgi:hypothetical protein
VVVTVTVITVAYIVIRLIVTSSRISSLDANIRSALPRYNQLRQARGAGALEVGSEFGQGFGAGVAEASDSVEGWLIGKGIELVTQWIGGVGKSDEEKSLERHLAALHQAREEARSAATWGIIGLVCVAFGFLTWGT